MAPLLLLIFIDSRPWRSGLAWAGLAQLLAFFVNWRGMIPVPGAWYYLVAGIYALAYFLPFVVHRLLTPRLAGFGSTLILPVSWVAVEIIFQKLLTPYGSWASLAYTQVGFLPLIQIAAVTGVAGIHFVILWSAAVAAWAWRQGRPFARVRTGVVTCGAVLALLLGWGQWRLVSRAPEAPWLQVAALTPSAELTRQVQDGGKRLARHAQGCGSRRHAQPPGAPGLRHATTSVSGAKGQQCFVPPRRIGSYPSSPGHHNLWPPMLRALLGRSPAGRLTDDLLARTAREADSWPVDCGSRGRPSR